MRRLLARLTVPAFLLGACRGPSREPGHSVIQDRIALPGLSPAALALSEFRPRVRADVDTGGRCREDFYWSARGYRAVVWRRDGENRRFWTIQVATDSAGVVRRYYEDRYGYTAGRTIILVDFDAGRGSVENDIPDLPAQTAAADAATVFHAPQLDDPSLQAARILERCRASLDPWGSLARFPDSLTAPPPPRPLPRAPSVDRSFRDSTLGVGYLAPGADGVNNFSGFEWLGNVIVPVYDGPDTPVAGWLARGWMARRGAPRWSWGEWTVGGWIGTSSEGTALPVLVLRDDGWLRFRYAPPTPDDDGTVWTHRSYLALGDILLAVTRWEDHFLHQDVPTYFRELGRHPLRGARDDTSAVLAWLEGRVGTVPEYSVAPLEIDGDWMRVSVHWPGEWCGTAPQRTAEGWIRWRRPDTGPMVAIRGFIC